MNTLHKAERILVDANRRLLELAGEIGEGKRVGLDAETTMQIGSISKEIGKAVSLLFASDGSDEIDALRLTLQ